MRFFEILINFMSKFFFIKKNKQRNIKKNNGEVPKDNYPMF